MEITDDRRVMSTSTKTFNGKQGLNKKTLLTLAMTSALGGIASDAEAYFDCKQVCERIGADRRTRDEQQCEGARQESDRSCDQDYPFGSSAHQACKGISDQAERRCVGDAEREEQAWNDSFCWWRHDCS
jgi:hypothetical protein